MKLITSAFALQFVVLTTGAYPTTDAGPVPAPRYQQEVRVKPLDLGTATVGDCSLTSSLSLRSSGLGTFSGDISTSESMWGDIWHMKKIKIVDGNGQEVFTLGGWDSPKVQKGETKHWQVNFNFPADQFDRISDANIVEAEC